MALTVPAFLDLGNEFMPPLNEGVLLYMPTAPPGMSTTAAQTILQTMDRELKDLPGSEVGVREDGPRRDLDRPGADRDGRDRGRAEAARRSGGRA